MVIFVDVPEKALVIYGDKGVEVIGFEEVCRLRDIVGDQKIMYVTNAISASVSDIEKLVSSLSGNISLASPITANTSRMVLRSLSKGKIQIASHELIFEGYSSYYPLDKLKAKFGADILDKDGPIKRFKDQKMLEVTTIEQAMKDASTEAKKRQAEDDKKYNSILVDEDHDKYMDKIRGGSGDDHGAPEFEVSGTGGSSGNNEGTLVPDDMV